jgi:hypothetical protein
MVRKAEEKWPGENGINGWRRLSKAWHQRRKSGNGVAAWQRIERKRQHGGRALCISQRIENQRRIWPAVSAAKINNDKSLV